MNETTLSPALQEQLRILSEGYARKLPDKLSQISALWRAVLEGDDSRAQESSSLPPDALSNLHRMVHSLAGSGATFGFAEVSQHARRAEIVLKPLALGAMAPDAAQIRDIEAALRDLEQVATLPHSALVEAGLEWQETARGHREVVLLTDCAEGVKSWVPALEAFGYDVRICTSAHTFRLALGRSCSALLIDCCTAPDAMKVNDQSIASLLHDTGAGTLFPLVWTARSGSLEARLSATRLGGSAFFAHPVDVDALVGKLDGLTNSPSPEPFRVLIVDDEPSLTRLFALILRQAGIETREVNDPLSIMEPLVDFRPDLILMDVFMPGCKGTELAAVLRQQDAFFNTPIVFLSVESDPFQQQQALRTGGDDFLCKPIEPRNLVSAVSMRAERSRRLRHLVSHDIVTGLPNHTRLREQLEIEVARAMRQNQQLSFALVDIDQFRLVNECHSYAAGDRVLRALGRMLGQHLRATDVVGRYGGEEFAVIMPGASAANAARRLDEVRAAFAALPHQANGEEFRATFSCGLACVPSNGDSSGTCEAAEDALQKAKAGGRNRVVTF